MSAKKGVSELVQRIEGFEHDYEIVSLYKDEDEGVLRFEVRENPAIMVQEDK